MFLLNSDITIGGFRFTGVNHVRITRSLHSIIDTATIKIPALARVLKNGKASANQVVTGSQFTNGDHVTIKLGYNGNLKTEFIGFVKRMDSDMPLQVVCEGYSWLLQRNLVNISLTAATIKDLLALAIKGIDKQYPITVKCTVNITLNNVQINGSGLSVIDAISKYTDGNVRCFFTEPDVLWCGLVYSPIAKGTDQLKRGTVQYRPGYNIPYRNTLKRRTAQDDPVGVKYSKKIARGEKLYQLSDAFKNYSRTHSRILNQLTNAPALKQLANEKAISLNYTGYEGSLHTFLEPYAAPGYQATIHDTRYPERNGQYLIESVDTHFGVQGAGRTIEVGPSFGFATKH